MDCGWIDCRLARRTTDEGGWLRYRRGHHSRHPRRPPGWLDLWTVGNLARWRHDWLHHRGIYWRGDSGLDYAFTEKGLIVAMQREAHPNPERAAILPVYFTQDLFHFSSGRTHSGGFLRLGINADQRHSAHSF